MNPSPDRRGFLLSAALAAIAVPSSLRAASLQADARCAMPARSDVPARRLATLARGFNLTGWFDGDDARVPDRAMLAELRRRGFRHIRLPLKPELVIAPFAPADAAAARLRALDRGLDLLLDLGYGVSLDVHPGARFSTLYRDDPDRGLEVLRALWTLLARRYAGRDPDRLFFEVLNEPEMDEEIWNRHGPLVAAAIRKAAPLHTLIYGPASYQHVVALARLKPLVDRNVVYAFHFYDPMIFTHQGLDWSEGPLARLHGVPFPIADADERIAQLRRSLLQSGDTAAAAALAEATTQPWSTARVEEMIALAGRWSSANGPVIVNEFGVLRWKAPPADRYRWLRAVREATENNCIGWAHWEYADAFGLLEMRDGRLIPDEAAMAALLGPRR
jgi:endoglucanase